MLALRIDLRSSLDLFEMNNLIQFKNLFTESKNDEEIEIIFKKDNKITEKVFTFNEYGNKHVNEFIKTKQILAISYYDLLSDWKLKSVDNEISISYEKDSSTNNFNVLIKFKFTRLIKNINQLTKYLSHCFINKNTVSYGVGYINCSKSLPDWLLLGWDQDFHNEKEKRIASYFNDEQDYSNQIPDIFYINLLTDNHLPDEQMQEEISKIVGKDYFYKLNEHAYVLQIPVEIEEVDGEEFEIYRRALYEVFEKYDKVIKLD